MPRILNFILLLCMGAWCAFAADGVPTLERPLGSVTLSSGNPSSVTDLRNHFSIPGVSGTIAQFTTTSGVFNVELLANDAPKHVTNFTSYVSAGTYDNTMIHRSAALSSTGVSIVQGGGYTATLPTNHVAENSPVPLEYKVANARGTLAAARTSDVNSATSEWYFNVQDNSTVLGPTNGGGYTVFGRVVGTGMSVVDALAAVPVYNLGSAFTNIPLRNVQPGQSDVFLSNLVVVSSIRIVPRFPASPGQAAVATFTASSSNNVVATASISGSELNIVGKLDGQARITIRATDSNGNSAEAFVDVTVEGLVQRSAPVITASPQRITVPSGSYAVLTASASGVPEPTYQWFRYGMIIPGATKPQLVFSSVTSGTEADYTVVATNDSGAATSQIGHITVVSSGSSALVNLSVRASMSADNPLIVGFSSSGDKTILVRGVGPGLAPLGIPNFFADPRLELYRSVGMGSVLANQNEDWSASLAPVFKQVYAFDLPAGSKDTALQHTINGAYTAHVKGTGNGIVLVEAYDSGTTQPTRLGNVSARYVSGSGDRVLIAGFTVNGTTAKTLLIRGVGPKLADYGVSGVLEDPKLYLYSGSTLIAENDSWDASIATISDSTGAFPLTVGSKDAAFLITLPPGAYTAQVSGPAPGEALVEVYELP